MDEMGSFLEDTYYGDGAGLEECLSRDVSMLREALASDNEASDEFLDPLGEVIGNTWVVFYRRGCMFLYVERKPFV